MASRAIPYRAGTLDLRAVREELGLSQGDFAMLLAVSHRTIQSCEQEWRKPSTSLEKSALMMLMAHRNRSKFGTMSCWKSTRCPAERRKECIAYWSRQGHLCWFMTGTVCKGIRMKTWPEKMALCQECKFFSTLIRGRIPVVKNGR